MFKSRVKLEAMMSFDGDLIRILYVKNRTGLDGGLNLRQRKLCLRMILGDVSRFI